MRSVIIKSIVLVMLTVGCTPALGADHLDCMSVPMGEAEQIVLDRHHEARRGDDKLTAAVQTSLESRARVCAYLNGWSSNATRLAFEYKWLQVQWERIPSDFSADEQGRLNIALEPMRSRLIALMVPSVNAVARGEDPPPPPLGGAMFREFYVLLKAAKIPQNTSNEGRLGGWLYEQGFRAAVVAAFSTE